MARAGIGALAGRKGKLREYDSGTEDGTGEKSASRHDCQTSAKASGMMRKKKRPDGSPKAPAYKVKTLPESASSLDTNSLHVSRRVFKGNPGEDTPWALYHT